MHIYIYIHIHTNLYINYVNTCIAKFASLRVNGIHPYTCTHAHMQYIRAHAHEAAYVMRGHWGVNGGQREHKCSFRGYPSNI